MKAPIRNWIFVTGAPRSGTTFLGKLLSAPLSVDYIHEPFNPEVGIPGFDQHYIYLRKGTEKARRYDPLLQQIFSYRLKLRTGYFRQDSAAKKAVKFVLGSRGPFYLRLAKCNPFHTAAVIKDPIGCLMAEYMAHEYGVKPVVIVKHPYAFVASLLRMGWAKSRTVQFLESQPEILEEYFPGQEASLLKPQASQVEGAATQWMVLNTVLLAHLRRNPSWQLVLHEKLSFEPVKTVQSLYHQLGLPWSERIARLVRRNTREGNPAEARGGQVQDFRRDSRALVRMRGRSLSPEQRDAVRRITQPLVEQIYEPAFLEELEKTWRVADA